MSVTAKDMKSIAVVGGVNIDIGGKPDRSLIPGDSNPGTIRSSLGGVGRNIAHNVSLLGLPVHFLTAIGDDLYAQRIESSCAELNIDISRARRVSGAATSCYLYLTDEHGDMVLAVADMEICREISPVYLAVQLPLLNAASCVAVDCNLPGESLQFLAAHCAPPIFADPVSVTKADRLKPILGRIHTLKPNRLEAEVLSGMAIRDQESLRQAAEKLLATGLERVFITLGSEGVYAADHSEQVLVPATEAEIRNTTGSGDAFMAALIWAYGQNLSLKESAEAACVAAAIASESQDTINPELGARFFNTRRRKQ